ncbi:MAG: CRISPR-associated helicase/endonuclease Cas3 [Sandaracinaceae bacterium]
MLENELKCLGAEATTARKLARAVVAHHGEFPQDDPDGRRPATRQLGPSPRWQQARSELVAQLAALFGTSAPLAPLLAAYDHGIVMILAGLTSVADWVGSMDQVFRYEAPPPSLAAYWSLALERADTALSAAGLRPTRRRVDPSFRALFAPYAPWPLHSAAESVAAELDEPSLVIVEAPMGEGKTETAFLLATSNAMRAGQEGFFIGLPTQATANQMFVRTRDFLEKTYPGAASSLVLAHGEASLVMQFDQVRLAAIYDRDDEGRPREGRVRAEAWFLSKKRTLLAEHAVGTIDQALLAVMRVAHGFVRVFGLAGKTVILDEVHAYDTYTSKLLDRLLEWLGAVGASVVLLSATLPSARRRALADAYARGRGLPRQDDPSHVAYPRITVTTSKGTLERSFEPRGTSMVVALQRCEPDVDAMVRLALERTADGGCAGIIVNTVARAQDARARLRELAPNVEALLLHARLLPEDRGAREDELADWLGPPSRAKNRPARCVVIGTQVLEQSLDIDFDVLITDLAPIDLVLQRAGRLHRHRRDHRPADVREPRLFVAMPPTFDDAVVERIAGVYSRLIVQRTFDVLSSRARLALPDDIELLVEEVYDASRIPQAGDPTYDAFLAHHGAQQTHAGLASRKLLDSPAVRADIFQAFKVFLTEDDGADLHAALRAETRLGPPSVELVCLERDEHGTMWAGARNVDLDEVPDRALTEALVRRSIGVTRRAVVAALAAVPGPASWKESGVLRHRRPVIFDRGAASVGGVELRLDPELGLVMSAPAKGENIDG